MIKNWLQSLAVIICLTGTPFTAVLAASNTPGLFFFGVGTGAVNYSLSNSTSEKFKNEITDQLPGIPLAFSADDSDSGLRISGGYQFNKNLSAVVSFTDLGQFSYNGSGSNGTNIVDYQVSTDTFGVAVGGEYAYPLMDNKLVPYARAGILMWSSESELTATSSINGRIHGSQSNDGIDAAFGLGANYFFNNYIGVGLGWDRYKISDAFGGSTFEMDFLSLTLFMTPGY